MMNRDIRQTATGYGSAALRDLNIWLPDMIRETMRGGSGVIQDRTFTNCLLEGPAVFLALGGVQFDTCNMGITGGDMRNLVLRPAGPRKVVGAIPFQNCTFTDCDFMGVGFTGPEGFLQAVLSIPTSPDQPS
jgi:uncharacterized protein YjbI with pentapeptide repeats